MAAFLVDSIDGSILNIAIPVISRTLNIPPLSLKLAVTAYLLSMGVFIPVSGWMADRFGSRNVFAAAVAIFGLSSVVAGLSVNLPMLVVARLVQGFGGAMMVPVGRLIILREYAPSRFVKAMNLIVLLALIGNALAPMLGGVIIAFFSWRWIFFVNLPFSLVMIVLVWRYIKDDPVAECKPFAWKGFFLLGMGLAFVLFGFSALGQAVGGVRSDVLMVVLGVLFLASYVLFQGRKHNAVINPRIFDQKNFRRGVTFAFLMRLGLQSVGFVMSLLLQLVLGYTPLQAAFYLSFGVVGMMLAKLAIRFFLRHFSLRSIVVSNGTLIACIILSFTTLGATTPQWQYILSFGLFGFCLSSQFTCLQIVNYADVKTSLKSQVTSFASAMQNVAKSFSIAIAALLLGLLSSVHGASYDMAIGGFHDVFVILAAIVLVFSWCFLFLDRQVGASLTAYSVKNTA